MAKRHRITDIVAHKAANMIYQQALLAMRTVKEYTPVLTGETQKAWRCVVNGREYTEEELRPSLFNGVRQIQITNPKPWIDELNKKSALMALAELEIEIEIRVGKGVI
jgi:hypothetical protein